MAAGTRTAAQEVPRRVRSSEPAFVALIDRAIGGSISFARLVHEIEQTNGIVYIEPGSCGHGVRACLQTSMVSAGGYRFLRVLVTASWFTSDEELMGTIGHELQHATEALSERNVTNGTTLYNFFRRYAPTDAGTFETSAAIHVGDAVREEVRAYARTAQH